MDAFLQNEQQDGLQAHELRDETFQFQDDGSAHKGPQPSAPSQARSLLFHFAHVPANHRLQSGSDVANE
ncbi:hypothetical protein D3C77_291930 [compost metagenome]